MLTMITDKLQFLYHLTATGQDHTLLYRQYLNGGAII